MSEVFERTFVPNSRFRGRIRRGKGRDDDSYTYRAAAGTKRTRRLLLTLAGGRVGRHGHGPLHSKSFCTNAVTKYLLGCAEDAKVASGEATRARRTTMSQNLGSREMRACKALRRGFVLREDSIGREAFEGGNGMLQFSHDFDGGML